MCGELAMKEMAFFAWLFCGKKIEATFVICIFFLSVGILVQVSKNNKY